VVAGIAERYRVAGTRAFGLAAATEDDGGGSAVHAAQPRRRPSATPCGISAADRRYLSITLGTSCVNQESVPRTADTRGLRSAQRSWRAIETAGREAGFLINEADHQRFAGHPVGHDASHGRNDTDKVSVQGAASIGRIAAMVGMVVLMRLSHAAMVRMFGRERSERAGGCVCVSARGRCNSGELGDHEKGDQEPNKRAYRPQPFHL
jgi:hypothetical protein